MSARHWTILAAVVIVLACVAGWRVDRTALLAAWLAAWWCWAGLVMGGLAQIWLHNLTGGNWGEPIRAPLQALGRSMWFVSLLFLPVLLALAQLYPWAHDAVAGPARWAGELARPGFKSAWLQPSGFVLRSVAWLLLWNVLAWYSQPQRLARSRAFSAIALISYSLSASIAAFDWIMSLMPLWYSSVFGLIVLMAQATGGMALAIVFVLRARASKPELLGDLANLLLSYIMMLAYLAFMQFLIIWAENLPHEIVWYTARRIGAWPDVARLLALLLFAVPCLALLFRAVKRNPAGLAWIAWLVLAMLLLHAWWLVMPSLPAASRNWPWAAPLGALALATAMAVFFALQGRRWRRA